MKILGYYGYGTGLESLSQCSECPAGYKCPRSAMKESDLELCEEGYYCHDGTIEPTKCPEGYYCPQQSKYAEACGPGTYNPFNGSIKKEDCQKCPPGFACPGHGGFEPLRCEAGYYCPENSNTTKEIPCPAGYYCKEGASSVTGPCPTGTWSDQMRNENEDDCVTCPDGFRCDDSQTIFDIYTALLDCNSPTSTEFGWCKDGEWSPCPKGHMCEDNRQSVPVKCPDGYYQLDEGKKSCEDCPEDQLCLFDEGVEPVSCPLGWNCGARTIYDATPCPSGQYHDGDNCVNCEEGRYCPTIGAEDQEFCEQGYYCQNGATIG